MKVLNYENIIVGGGLAGISTAIELLDHNKKVLIVERDIEEHFGGLAKRSFGGILFSGTPQQKKAGIKDSPQLLFEDWMRYGDFTKTDTLGAQWAKYYSDNSISVIYNWLIAKKVDFLPVVNWPERGMDVKGNSVPRWHITWGTGYDLTNKVTNYLLNHPKKEHLEIKFQHKVESIIIDNKKAVGIEVIDELTKERFNITSENIIIASGGIMGSDLKLVKSHWPTRFQTPPDSLLNGSHKYADGTLHLDLDKKGIPSTHLNKQWHYAAGIPTPNPESGKFRDGLSLVPPRSAIWVDATGKRFTPPLVAYTDTSYFVEHILKTKDQYSWSIMNWKIAIKELAVSGSDYMTAFRNRDKLRLIKDVLFGNKDLVNRLIEESDHFIVADNLADLVKKMNEQDEKIVVDFETLEKGLKAYDDEIDRGKKYFNDEQLRRLVNFRLYKGDKIRTSKFQKILDPKAGPLIAVKQYILSRKSLGGIPTNLNSQVIDKNGDTVSGLYAVGESAGFGGGGIHGSRSLEGTFLGSCILTGRVAGAHIAGIKL
ncbi:FAD-dependent oxidoreductase [Gelidibacter japonicus]|uniref:FAD-binding protein n=1 Tax=Gelidibacter japonicus TaxID=1962232 RepID=UPI0020209AEB|nr:FAD-binding protein [Gelidibacter japonicus]MCL8008655.1 FAD-dependent oxidoreductase [Gelidibacter japonicus]